MSGRTHCALCGASLVRDPEAILYQPKIHTHGACINNLKAARDAALARAAVAEELIAALKKTKEALSMLSEAMENDCWCCVCTKEERQPQCDIARDAYNKAETALRRFEELPK